MPDLVNASAVRFVEPGIGRSCLKRNLVACLFHLHKIVNHFFFAICGLLKVFDKHMEPTPVHIIEPFAYQEITGNDQIKKV
jgi:hypothetical protein